MQPILTPHPWHFALPAVLMLLTACGTGSDRQTVDSGPKSPPDTSMVTDAVPFAEPPSRYGNPKSYEVFGERYRTLKTSQGYRERGIASWYGKKFHGRRTSSGEPYDMYAMTAAHKSLPLPTHVRVRNLANEKSIVVRVNDRGPFHEGRIIDLSYTAATKLGMVGHGTAQVEVTALPPYQAMSGSKKVARKAPATRTELAAAGISNAVKTATNALGGSAFVQVGAFSSLENAERLRARVESQVGQPVSILEVPESSATYRVRVGPLSHPSGTDSVNAQLATLGIRQVHVVPH